MRSTNNYSEQYDNIDALNIPEIELLIAVLIPSIARTQLLPPFKRPRNVARIRIPSAPRTPTMTFDLPTTAFNCASYH